MKYTFSSRIRFSEVDEDGILSLPSLINYLQDCATFHGEETGVGIAWIAENRQTWMLSSFRLQINRYPRYAESIDVSTWATGFRGFLGNRDFLVTAQDGSVLAEGKSDWVYMDMRENKPMKVSKVQTDAYGLEPQLALPDVYGKRKIRTPEQGVRHEPFVIYENHLDTNRHVNSGQYILMAQRYLPAGFRAENVRAEYRQQAYLGDVIVPVLYETEQGYIVALESESGERYFTGAFSGLSIHMEN